MCMVYTELSEDQVSDIGPISSDGLDHQADNIQDCPC